jgi:hypothetical protein
MTITTRIGRNHIIISDDDTNDDDYEIRRRRRLLPYNTLTVNKANNTSNYCPQCKRGTTGGKLVNLLYHKEMSAFICPVCSYVRYVNPTNRNEISPGSTTTTTEPGIPTLDGLTDQQALERESGGRRKKPIIRSIGDPRLRSQYSSSSANRRFGDDNKQADAETRAWAQNHNASIVAYSEKILQDSNNVVSSKELKWRDKF